MGEFASALDEVLAQDPHQLADAELGDRLLDLERGMARLMGAFLQTLAAFDARSAHLDDACPTTAAWLRRRCRLAPGEAAARVRTARAMRDELADALAALSAGDVSWTHTRIVAEAVGRVVEGIRAAHPGVEGEAHAKELARAAAPLLVDAARILDPRDTARVTRRWRHLVDMDGFDRDVERQHRRRRLHVSATYGGMVRIDGELDPEGGQVVLSAISALSGPDGSDDQCLPAQRRADALVEICRRELDRGTLPSGGGEQPHVLVELTLDTLERRLGSSAAELPRTGPISAEAARRLACDAGITRVITGPDSEPLDVGRKTRVVPAALRRALVHRDRGCAWPGCDALPEWTDAHHIHHWADGGPTSLRNLVLLCRRHHRMVHDGGRQLPERHAHAPPARAPDEEPW